MAQYCSNCGSVLDDGVRFCTACGTAVETLAAVPPHPPSSYPYQPHPIQPELNQGWTQAPPFPVYEKSNNWLMVVLVILLIVQVVLIALFGWPGFAVSR